MNAEGNTFRWTNLVPDESNTFLWTNFLPGNHTALRIRADSEEDMSSQGIVLPSYMRTTMTVPVHRQVLDSSPIVNKKSDSECESNSTTTLESESKRSETKKKRTKDKKKKKHKHRKKQEPEQELATTIQQEDSKNYLLAGMESFHSESNTDGRKKKSKKKKRHSTTVTLDTPSTPLDCNITAMTENEMHHSPHKSETARLLTQLLLQDIHQPLIPAESEKLTNEHTNTRENVRVPSDTSNRKGESSMKHTPQTNEQMSPSKVESRRSKGDIDPYNLRKPRSKSSQPATRTHDSTLRHSPQRVHRGDTSEKFKSHRKKSKSTPSTPTNRRKLLKEILNDKEIKSSHQLRNEHHTKQRDIRHGDTKKRGTQERSSASSIQGNNHFTPPLVHVSDLATRDDLEHNPSLNLDGLVLQGTVDTSYPPHHVCDTSVAVRQPRNSIGTLTIGNSGTETVTNQNSRSYAVIMSPYQVGRQTKLNQSLLQHMTSHDTKNTDDDSSAKITEVSVGKLSNLSLEGQSQDLKPAYLKEVKIVVKSDKKIKKLSFRQKMILACCCKPRDSFE